MNKKIIYTVFLCLTLALFSCDDKLSDVATSMSLPAHLNITMPTDLEGVAGAKISEEAFEIKNVTTGRVTTYSSRNGINLAPGLYDVSYEAVVEITDDNGNVTTKNIQAFTQGVEISAENSTINLVTFVYVPTDDFIISEVFFTGTLRPTGNQYYGDDYIKIYNNTDHVLYADGLTLLESKFTTTQKYNYRPNVMANSFTVHAIYTIPGSGTDYPVQPGEELLICDTGIDHRVANENSFDLSHADFEWYDVSTSPTNLDIDSPTVPNLDKWYCYTATVYGFHNRGFRSYAIARMQTSKENWLENYAYTAAYTWTFNEYSFDRTVDTYKVPNAWILDAVNLSVESEFQWIVTSPALDAGWTYCGKVDKDQTRYNKAVIRKKDADGKYIDTNNSTNDFEPEAKPSYLN